MPLEKLNPEISMDATGLPSGAMPKLPELWRLGDFDKWQSIIITSFSLAEDLVSRHCKRSSLISPLQSGSSILSFKYSVGRNSSRMISKILLQYLINQFR